MKLHGPQRRQQQEPQKTQYARCLRSNQRFLLNPQAEEQFELKVNVQPKAVCPPLKRQTRSLYNPDMRYGAVALGMKGKLAREYNRKVKETYLNQMFEKVNNIGQGSFGDVYTYRSRIDGKCYAIKVLKRYHSNEKYGEIRKLDMVGDNEFCVGYVNAWEEFGNIFIQFKLSLMSLGMYGKLNHSISEDECWQIIHDVIRAIKFLHDRGLAHMDIKPDNILIGHDGVYRLCDFGLLTDVTTVDFNKSFLLSEGDSKYLADEVLRGEVSVAGDIFSLGITLLEMCTDLLLPVSGPCWHALRDGAWRNVKGVSCNLAYLIHWMMKLSPDERPTAKQILCSDHIKRMSRLKKQRFNYFEQWRETNNHVCLEVPFKELQPPLDPADYSHEEYVTIRTHQPRRSTSFRRRLLPSTSLSYMDESD